MTIQAQSLLWISIGIFSVFFISIVCSWFYGYFSDLYVKKVKGKIEDLVSSFFLAEDEERLPIVHSLKSYVDRSARRKEFLIDQIISYETEFIDRNHDLLMNFYEETGITSFLIKRLTSKNMNKKSLACRHIGDLKLVSTEAHILQLVSCKNNDVIYNMLLALAKLGDTDGLAHILTNDSGNINISSRAIIEIISAFNGSKEQLFKATIPFSDDYFKGILIKAAADYEIAELRDYYIEILNSDNKNLRIASIRALSELKNPANEQYMIDMLEDKDWEVRAIAAKCLEKLGTHHCFPALGKSTGDREWWVRHNAANSLISIPGGREYAAAIIDGDDPYARDAVVSVLEKIS